MSSSNFVRIGGRLTRDPEIQYTDNGNAVCKFTLAVNQSENKTFFFDCIAWNKAGLTINEKKKKGDYLKVQGTLNQDKWQDKQTGQNRSKVVINVNETIATYTEKKEKQQGYQQGNQNYRQQPQHTQNQQSAPNQKPRELNMDQGEDWDSIPF